MGEKRILAFKICITFLSLHKKLKTSAILTGDVWCAGMCPFTAVSERVKEPLTGVTLQWASEHPDGQHLSLEHWMQRCNHWSQVYLGHLSAVQTSRPSAIPRPPAGLCQLNITSFLGIGKCQPPVWSPDQEKEVSETAQVMCLGVRKYLCAFFLLRK